jgi:hypothetical protein
MRPKRYRISAQFTHFPEFVAPFGSGNGRVDVADLVRWRVRPASCAAQMTPFHSLAIASTSYGQVNREFAGCRWNCVRVRPWRPDCRFRFCGGVSVCSLMLLGSPLSPIIESITALNRSLPEASLRANVPYSPAPGEFGHYTRRSLGISTVFGNDTKPPNFGSPWTCWKLIRYRGLAPARRPRKKVSSERGVIRTYFGSGWACRIAIRFVRLGA